MKKIILALVALFYYNANAQTPFQLGNTLGNRRIVMFESANNDHQFFGFGINNQMQRYQVGATTSSHAFFAGATTTTSNELMRITGTGNVGIGTITPNAQLQLGNTIANRKIVLFEVADNDQQYYGLGVNNQIFRYQVDNTISSHAFYAGTSVTTSNELMRITGTGNVGIGTTAPSEKLHVAGSVRIVDGTQGVGKVLTSDANGKGTWTTSAAGGNTSELQKITEGSNTGWRILGRDAANYGDIGNFAIDLSAGSASTTRGATGSGAFATGFGTTASNSYTTAFGQNSIASGVVSTAMGESTIASGIVSTAMGSASNASGIASTAMGFSTRATGFVSTAIGNQTRATGDVSTASGFDVRAKSYGEFAIGTYNDTLTTANSTGFGGDNNRIFTVGTGTPSARRTSFVIQQNGNVGIGNASPNAPLQFASNEASRKVVLYEIGNNDHQFYGLGVNSFIFRYQVDNTAANHVFFAGASATASTELMRITGTGNIGIGTAAPTERLHVAGSVRIVDGTQGAGKVLTSDANGRGTWTTPAAGGVSELQKITEGSNIGWRLLGRDALNFGDIGSNALDLSVSNTASTTRGATGNNALATGIATIASGGGGSTAMGSTTTASGFSSFAMGNSTRAAQYASTAMGNSTTATGIVSTATGDEVRAKSFGEFAIGSYNDTLTTVNSTTFAGDNNRIFTVGTGTSAARRTSFVVQQNGNVGIGASAPNAPLQFENTLADRKIVMFESGNNNHQYFGFGIGNQLQRYQVGATSSSHAFFAGVTATTSNELMRITGAGNVGIGTTAPNAPLQFANTEANRKIVLIEGNNNNHEFYGFGINFGMLRHQVQGTAASHAFFASTSATTSNELMRITGTGNVGIGTSNPLARLHVNGNTRIDGTTRFTGAIQIEDGSQAAGRVLTSDNAGNATWATPASGGGGGNTSQLEIITESGKTGHRLLGRTAANYGDIGSNSIDLSRSTGASTTRGATGDDSFAFGVHATASGNRSAAIGEFTIASGGGSFASGSGTSAIGTASVAMGLNTTALGNTSFAMGNVASAQAIGSIAIGNFLTSSGNYSIAMGNYTRATADGSSAFGNFSDASGSGATAMGSNTQASGQTSTAMGNTTKATGLSSTAMGNQSFAVGDYSTAMGFLTRARSLGELSIGFFNDTLTNANSTLIAMDNNRIFTVGAGTSLTNRATAFVVQQNSNVGIGTGAPTQRLHVVGNIVYTGTSSAISDLRYKTNFTKIENPLNKVLALNGLHYDWKVGEFKENNFTKDRQIGFIAQEIEKIFPEMVQTDSKGYKSVDYGRLTPVLVEAIKELKTLNDELKGKNEKLEAKGQKLEARLDKIEALLNR